MDLNSEKRIGAYINYDAEENNEETDHDGSRRGRYASSEFETGGLDQDDAPSEVIDSLPPSDDPVKMYLKEIGQVPLLDSNREMWLSTQIAAERHLEALARRANAF